MQRVTNCMLIAEESVLLLQKPSRGWWVAPGGKMELGETIKESARREFYEETGLHVEKPQLRAVSTIVMMEKEKCINEWMMFTFAANRYSGHMLDESPEGILKWVPKDKVANLPMAEGDVHIFRHILNQKGLMYSTFYYTSNFQLLSYRIEPSHT